MSYFEYEPTADNILSWLDEGGYSCVLYLGARRAYVTDEDDDDGWRHIPVAIARQMLTDGTIALWDDDAEVLAHRYRRYRPTGWVAGWNMGQRPWNSATQNQLILNMHIVEERMNDE